MKIQILSKKESLALKGVAILLVMFHHLFAPYPQYQLMIGGTNVLNYAAATAKVCVAMFLILSGYGLAESIKDKKVNWLQFMYRRFKGLYTSFWPIYIVFVGIYIFVFGKTPEEVWSKIHTFDVPTWVKMLSEFFGLHIFFFGHGYNETWWFLSLIVGLYLFFPFLYVVTKEFKIVPLILSFIMITSVLSYSLMSFNWMNVWVPPFILGIYISVKSTDKVVSFINKLVSNVYFVLLGLPILIAGSIYLRYNTELFKNERADFLIATLFMMFCLFIIRKSHIFTKVISYFGDVSYEIFLFHTFIYLYWFHDYIYSLNNPILIFAALSIICLIVAVILKKATLFIISLFKFKPTLIELNEKRTSSV